MMTGEIPLNKPFFLIIAGKPGSGKSHLIKFIMMINHPNYSNDPFEYGIVFTKTKFNGNYDDYIPDKLVHCMYNEQILANLLKMQADTQGAHRAFLILDDCLEERAFRSQLFTDLCTQFRHYNISFILSTQYIYKVPPTLRECSTGAIMFRQTTDASMDALWRSFGQWFGKCQDFKQYLLENTGDHKFIFFQPETSHEETIDEVYKVMKSPANIPRFMYLPNL